MGKAAGWTRAQALRAALGGGIAAGGAALIARTGGDAAQAAPSPRQDRDILGLFLTLETVQAAFYEAAGGASLPAPQRAFARAALAQERRHVALLERHGPSRIARPAARFAAARDARRFADAAIELEELAIAAYIGQGGNLTRDAVRTVVPLVSVEARQAAWIRDVAQRTPAPRAADPPRDPGDVLRALRDREYLR